MRAVAFAHPGPTDSPKGEWRPAKQPMLLRTANSACSLQSKILRYRFTQQSHDRQKCESGFGGGSQLQNSPPCWWGNCRRAHSRGQRETTQFICLTQISGRLGLLVGNHPLFPVRGKVDVKLFRLLRLYRLLRLEREGLFRAQTACTVQWK